MEAHSFPDWCVINWVATRELRCCNNFAHETIILEIRYVFGKPFDVSILYALTNVVHVLLAKLEM